MVMTLDDLDSDMRFALKRVRHISGDGETPELGDMLVKIRDKCLADEYSNSSESVRACMFYNLENVIAESRHIVVDMYGIENREKDRWWSGNVDKVFQKDLKECYQKLYNERYGG